MPPRQLRYYAQILARRFDELKNKYASQEEQRVRNWFNLIKDHVTHKRRHPDFPLWSCYEGVFSVSTIYYTCCYFQCARDLMAHVPFREILPPFSVELEEQLEKVGQAFVWDNGEAGIRPPLQEVIGDAFTTAPAHGLLTLTFAEIWTPEMIFIAPRISARSIFTGGRCSRKMPQTLARF